jgi:hypothetical protein
MIGGRAPDAPVGYLGRSSGVEKTHPIALTTALFEPTSDVCQVWTSDLLRDLSRLSVRCPIDL